MTEYRILSWNVNGIRAVQKKGFLDFLAADSPDILCLQETKARPEQLDEAILHPAGYQTYWNYPEKPGYAGVAVFTHEKPRDVRYDLGQSPLDIEGRVITVSYPSFTLMNLYYPNGGAGNKRVPYKLEFYDLFLAYADGLVRAGRNLVVCGDVNTAHHEIDLARPKENVKNTGFLPEERAWMDRFESHGYVDTFRHFHQEPAQYTYWDQKTRARERNVGWRIDYFFVNEGFLPAVKESFILPEIQGSDHCPIGIRLAVD